MKSLSTYLFKIHKSQKSSNFFKSGRISRNLISGRTLLMAVHYPADYNNHVHFIVLFNVIYNGKIIAKYIKKQGSNKPSMVCSLRTWTWPN